jgi:DNA-binding response OmpR family regulator
MYALLLTQDSDEHAILNTVLQQAGLSVVSAPAIEAGLNRRPDCPPDLILSALLQPDPLSQVQTLRSDTLALRILVVDPVSEGLQCQLLESGADLVVPRPLAARLLIAEIRALLRRTSQTVGPPGPPRLTLPQISLDPSTRMVQVGHGQPRRLTPLESRLLYTLMIHRGQVLPTPIIVERVWGYSGDGDSTLVRGLVRRLRAKVEPDAHGPRYILTVPGVGYTFEVEDPEPPER